MQKPKTKIEAKPESTIVIKQPMVRDFSTGGGHLPGDTIVEGDEKIVTKKWQGYPPQNLNVIGKSMPPMPEVAIPRFTGKAEYTTRVNLPNMLWAKLLGSPHPRATIKNIDTTRPKRCPASICTDVQERTEDLSHAAEPQLPGGDGSHCCRRNRRPGGRRIGGYRSRVHGSSQRIDRQQSMAMNAPDLKAGRGNLATISPTDPHYDPNATWVGKHGDIEKGFAESDVIKEFTYYFAGGVSVPIQPCGSVAKWDGDKLTLWGMGQGIYPQRAALARGLGIPEDKIRFINKYNGCTFGAARAGSQTFYPLIAHLAKVTGRPVKIMMPKDLELAQIQIKPENVTKFKIGAKKDGRIVAVQHEVYISGGDADGPGHATGEIAKNQTELYTSGVPHWKSTWRHLQDQFVPRRRIQKLYPAGSEMGMGKHGG